MSARITLRTLHNKNAKRKNLWRTRIPPSTKLLGILRENVMNKFEYKILSLQTGIIRQGKAMEKWEETLKELGEEGWELVAVIPMHAHLGFAGSTPQIRCFLKREKK